MSGLDPYLKAVGRVLMSVMYLLSGVQKLWTYGDTAQYMTRVGVPPDLLPLVIATEVLGALLIVVGWQTRWVALALAGFTLLAALLFHFDFGDRAQTINFMKNVTIAGGFLVLAAAGPGAFSLDARR